MINMLKNYQAFGLTLESNRLIPGLVPAGKPKKIDIQIVLEKLTGKKEPVLDQTRWYSIPDKNNGAKNLLTTWILDKYSGYRFHFHDGVEFSINQSGSRIQATWPDNMTLEDTTVYLLGPILGFVLTLRGFVCLHGSAIAVGEHAMALLGPGGMGKSTLAAAFARQGFRVLTDDILLIHDRKTAIEIQPSYPQIRLWPKSVKTLFGSEKALPRLTPNHPDWDKCYFNLNQNQDLFQKHPLPLKTVYVGQQDSDYSAPHIETLKGKDRLLALAANTYTSYKVEKKMLAREFDVLTQISQKVSLRRIKSSDRAGFNHINQLCHMILDDFYNHHESISLVGRHS